MSAWEKHVEEHEKKKTLVEECWYCRAMKNSGTSAKAFYPVEKTGKRK